MSKEITAFKDLEETLRAIPWLSVYTEKNKAGGVSWNLELFRGPTTTEYAIGCRKISNGYTLTLKTPGSTDPALLSERLNVINDTISADRRRGGSAQSTILDEGGWVPDEDEGREAFSITTNLIIYIHEVN